MVDDRFIILYKLRFILGGALIIVGLFLLSLVLSLTATSPKAKAANTTLSSGYTTTQANDNPNVVADFMSTVGDKSMQFTSSTEHVLNSSLHAITTSIVAVPARGAKIAAKGAYSGALVVADGVASGASFTAKGASGTVGFLARLPGKMAKLASPSNIVSATIKPAENVPVPTIKAPKSTTSSVSTKAPVSSSSNNAVASADAKPQWPLHGVITTLFGVPEWPYEAVHTGLDISDGTAPGTTPVKPFKPGRVIQVIHSSLGLGNHVIIDNGGGITSVYGHLNSISVHEGQEVDESTIVGYEGTTGASTGTHLHFEIHVNGQPEDPHKFIPGQP